MAAWYVYSGAAGTGSGADWANAKTTLQLAITAGAAGDTYYIAHDHVQTAAANTTITGKGSLTAPDRYLCVRRDGSVPPVASDLTTGASFATTGNSSLNFAPLEAYVYGLILTAGDGAAGSAASLSVNASASTRSAWESCSFILGSTNSTVRVNLTTANSSTIELNNCNVTFGAASQGLSTSFISRVTIRNKPGSSFINGGTVPTALFKANPSGVLIVSGVDLSALGSGTSIIEASTGLHHSQFINCKTDAAVTFAATPINSGATADFIGCGSTGNVARNERYQYSGTLTTETVIVRTGGASDGTTSYSWKVVTTANSKRDHPFRTFEGAIWNAATSSKTLTIHAVTDNVTLKDDEIWVEVEYLSSSATPVATLITDANATVLTTAANQATSTETWTTTGLTTPVKQELDVTFTPQMAGPIRWRVCVAKASTTVYIDPKPVIS